MWGIRIYVEYLADDSQSDHAWFERGVVINKRDGFPVEVWTSEGTPAPQSVRSIRPISDEYCTHLRWYASCGLPPPLTTFKDGIPDMWKLFAWCWAQTGVKPCRVLDDTMISESIYKVIATYGMGILGVSPRWIRISKGIDCDHPSPGRSVCTLYVSKNSFSSTPKSSAVFTISIYPFYEEGDGTCTEEFRERDDGVQQALCLYPSIRDPRH